MKSAYELKRSIPNKLLNADGSITDFQGNLIEPADEGRAKAFENAKSIPDKFITENGDVKTLSQVSLDLFEPVDTLPESGDKNKIYLLPADNGTFDEYYWTGEDWEILGSVSLDLSNYPTFDQMNNAIEEAINTAIYDVLGGEY